MKKIAEFTVHMECGSRFVTYIPCKGDKDLSKKLNRRYDNGIMDFGSVQIDDSSVVFCSAQFHPVH